MKNISQDDFSGLPIVLPSFAVQQQIAAILTTQDKVIGMKEKLIAKKQKQKKYLMQQLLTGKKRLKGFQAKWDKYTLRELGQFQSGTGFPERYQGNVDGDIPFYKVSDMNTNLADNYLTQANNYVSQETTQLIKASIIQSGAIIFAKVGAAVMLERKKILSRPSCIDNNLMAYVLHDIGYLKFV